MVDQTGHSQTTKQRKRPLEEYDRTWLGIVAVIVVSALIGTMLFIGALGLGHRNVTAHFLQAAALQPGNPITVAGVEVGKVKALKLAGDHVVVDMKVRNDVHLGKDSRAVIKITTILGSRYLALEPGGGGDLPDNTIDLNHTEVPYDLQAALADVATTYEQVNTDQFAQSLGVLGKQLKTLPPVVPQAMQNIHTLSTIIADRRDQLGELLKTTELVSNTLRSQQANIGNLVRQGRDLVGEFVARQAVFHAMMQSLTELATTLGDLAITNRPELEKLLADLRTLSDMLGQHDDLLRSTLQVGPVTLRQLANATGTGNAVELTVANGLLIDSWMCAISGRAKQLGMIQYFKDCK
jgi:virulence factor Mce-like protein